MSEENRESSEAPTGGSKDSEVIPGYSSIEQFTKDGFKVVMEAIKHSNALPSGRDWDFYTISDSFRKIMNDEGSSVLRLINQVMRYNDIESNIRNRVLDEKMELVIEANDVILEKVAINIDELNGISRSVAAPVVIQTVSAQLPVNGSWNRPSAARFTVNSAVPESVGNNNCIKLITGKNIVRPQKCFKDKIDNRNNYPWCPRITDKPNSLKPLAIFLEECEDRQEYSHPYEYELDRFAPTSSQLCEEKVKVPKNLSETPLIKIDQPEQLDDLVETLRSCKEFAVDVEHHSYRSFMGITCLLQISTLDKDYIIDTLALRDKLSILNEVFTKNTIVKIFHGADKDVEWLQRDLSIYVVNMFDTHQAAKALQYPVLSLAYLMKKFCNTVPNKQFQLADWRIRPLPEEFKAYAREDTHYLIYIYQMLKKELLLKGNKSDNVLRSVFERSTDICKKRYFKPLLVDDSHLGLYRKCKKMFDNRQLYALKEIYAWRDTVARQEDESLAYVLPNHMLLQIAEALPREMQGILACCNPIPPLVRSNLLELHQIVLRARDQPLERAILKETTTMGRGVLKKASKVNVDSALHCPHDLSKTTEFRDDLPTLLQNQQVKTDIINVADVDLPIEKASSYTIFSGPLDSDDTFGERERFKKMHGFAYFSPYERYKLVKPFIVSEDAADQARLDEENKESLEENAKQTENTQVEDGSKEKADEERIASIRDHFMKLSRKFSEELQVQKQKDEEEQRIKERSLIEMGGSRKRKRGEGSFSSFQTELATSSNSFHNPVPNLNSPCKRYMQRNRGRKRQSTEADNEVGETHDGGDVNKKKKKKNLPQMKLLRQQQTLLTQQVKQINIQEKQLLDQQKQLQQERMQEQEFKQRLILQQQEENVKSQRRQLLQQRQQLQQQRQGVQQKQQHLKQQRQNFNQQRQLQLEQNMDNQFHQQQNQQQYSTQVGQQNNQKPHLMPKKKKQNKNKNFALQQPEKPWNGQNQKQQKSTGGRNSAKNFVPYDYASVDFRQFQGGAGSASSGVQMKPNFKAKNRKNKGKKGTKSSTFSNTGWDQRKKN